MANSTKEKQTRQRPIHEQGEKVIQMTILDEMEEQAKRKLKAGGRVPLAAKLKLDWTNKEEGYHYEWATDSIGYPISLQQMLESGYTFVRHDFGQLKGQVIIQHSKGCKLYLMRQADEYHEVDENLKRQKSANQYQQINQVNAREYADKTGEAGKGKVANLSFEDTPKDAIDIMQGE